MMANCSKCGAEIMWLENKTTGKPAPIVAEPNTDGNIFINGNLYRIAKKDEIVKAKEIGKSLYINHFFDCKFAKEFKK